MTGELGIHTIEEALAQLGVNNSLLTEGEKQQLDEQGFIVLSGVIDQQWLVDLQAMYETLMAKEGQNAGLEVHQEKGTRRLADLINKGKVFDGCYTHPKVLAAVHHILGREFKLSAMNGRDAIPGEGHQNLHGDWEKPVKSGEPYHVAIALWMLDEFTPINGATRVVPGSHKLPGRVADYMSNTADAHPDEVLLTGPAGSIAVLNSHLWHGGTKNQTPNTRRALHPYYTAREHAQQQNQREYIRKLTYDRISPGARYLLDVD